MDLTGKTAVVTGAGRGIGRACALLLAQAGAKTALWSRSMAPLKPLVEQIESRGGKALAIQTDVSSEQDVKQAAELTKAELGAPDILINNAGMAQAKGIAEISPADWDRVFAVNAKGVFLCCRAVMDAVKQRGWGRIINLGSVGAKTGGVASGAHYCAAKAAVHTFSISLARDLAPHGVTVNVIAPGPVDTGMLQEISAASGGDKSMWESHIPLGRIARPEDVAHTALFLCQEQAGYLTGEIIDVNGGMFMD